LEISQTYDGMMVAIPSPHWSIFRLLTHLPSPFWGKANNFRRLFEFLLYYVATIKLAYIEIFP